MQKRTHRHLRLSRILPALVVALMILGSSSRVSAAACTTTINPGDSIQTAIDTATAGDVICLNPGTYSPTAKININKSVTIQGPQAGVDPRPSAGSSRTPGDTSTEAIIDGASNGTSGIIVITADNVILDGLEVKSDAGDLIDSETSTATTGTIIRYNIVDDATSDEGMQIRACTDCVIEYNYVFDIAQDGINICCGSTGGVIQFNEVKDSNSENAAIYIYESTNTTIQCNLVYNATDNDGIKLGDKNGGDAENSGGYILYNNVHDTAQDGITVYMSDTQVKGNDVSYSSSENGAIYVAFDVSYVSILENNVHDNTLDTGKWGDPGAIMIGTAVDATTASVNNNNITGNSVNGVTNKAGASLDAEDNWWGAADGPSGAGSGSGDSVSTDVDFTPWLTEAQIITNPCEPPVADPNGPYLGAVGNPIDFDGTGSSDPGGNPLTYAWDFGDSDSGTGETPSHSYDEAGIYNVCLMVNNGVLDSEEVCTIAVVYDPDAGFVTGGGWIDSPAGAYMPGQANINGVFTGVYTYEDTSIECDPNNSPVTFSGWVDATGIEANGANVIGLVDQGLRNTDDTDWFSGAYLYIGRSKDGTTIRVGPTDGFLGGEINQVGANVPYVVGGPNIIEFSMTIYDDQITVTYSGSDYVDDYGEIENANIPDAYPGGEFDSEAYVGLAAFPDTNSIDYDIDISGCHGPTGKATFGFVSKYTKKHNEVPIGSTEFQFQAGDLNFHSESYDWLVVNQNGTNAQFKGVGTINGEGNYQFMLWAGDNTETGDPDTFRIKIWHENATEEVVYDNGFEGSGYENGQPISGGNIVVHTKKK